ncbi:hypothetical protein HG535_0A07750 [Zygotorulaspora mrakii]|uniref:RNA polymerase II subunit A C-terminal domain phosphatase n=1 Tax=Zygotorulaspora mrakii TaxID=42260 RepID=A0A7H9AX62_ZYGMR|nr:uncharacterized protein HG535_0A07750 [Zygotorulaspora mrakii]QLG70833.1 hypothetical protein HG535_0A07750 [Zygotorulaspora mrakii]
MTTPVFSPDGLPYPITIDQLIAPIGSYVEKGNRLFAYKFWYMVEIANSPDDNDIIAGTEQHAKKKVRESIEFFEAPFEGRLMSWNVDKDDEVASSRQIICEITRPCNHDIVYGGLCTLCGKEVDENDQLNTNLAISHTDTNLKVSRKEAADIENNLKARLRKDEKLILVVDLDQTVIHCGVDPTIGEWKNDPSNPNYETLKDVKLFALEEEPILPLFYMGPKPPVRQCRYYVKVRPGLKEFFEGIAPLFEMHIYTMATRAYALEIAKIIDPDGSLFANRILSRDENGSLTQKSLERLFPTDQSMVVIIDDRGDVWDWSPNLIKVVPYNFFVGVGDINSNFLPRQQNTMLQVGRRLRNKEKESDELITDIMDTEKILQEKIDEEVKRQEEKLSHQISSNEESTASETKEDFTKKLEYSASLEVQQQNRPLATLQKHMHNQRLLVDDDDELYHLKETLMSVHKKYYESYERGDFQDTNIRTLMPIMKRKVFENLSFVFSGLIPLGTDIRKADIVLWTHMFGANSFSDVDENTTHVITRSSGTYKARMAKALNDKIKIVHPDWVFECMVTWKHVNEKPYELIIEEPATEQELEDFKRKLEQRKRMAEEQERHGLEFNSVDKSAKDDTVNLFAAGTSWLNDEEDEEFLDDIEDDEVEDEDEDEYEEQDAEEDGRAPDYQKESESTSHVDHSRNQHSEPATTNDVTISKAVSEESDRKRPLGDIDGSNYDQNSLKRYHIRRDADVAEEEDDESGSDLEDELLNALDD